MNVYLLMILNIPCEKTIDYFSRKIYFVVDVFALHTLEYEKSHYEHLFPSLY